MAWNAKRTGGYTADSIEFEENVHEIYNVLSDDSYLFGDAWSYEAIVGVLCNMSWESQGLNPWVYNGSRYGLVQSTFSYYSGQANGRFGFYAPSTGSTASGDGAQPTDGIAQCQVIDYPTDTLYQAYGFRQDVSTMMGWSTLLWDNLSEYKTCNDVDEAIQSWLLYYEWPFNTQTPSQSDVQNEYDNRAQFRQRIEEILGGGPGPGPHPTSTHKMPLYFYIGKKLKHKKGIL